MKKWFWLVLICILCAGAVLYTKSSDKKDDIINDMKQNLDTYAKAAEQVLENPNTAKKIDLDGVKSIEVWNNRQVDFTSSYLGFGSSAHVKGFYYSKDDVPRGWQGVELTFKKKEKGLLWEQEDGDNWCYVEKICDNWYYFEVSF